MFKQADDSHKDIAAVASAARSTTSSARSVTGANHDQDTPAVFPSWVERTVWTDRMLSALESGVHGGKWYSLSDKVCSPASLDAAWQQVRRNRGASGVDNQSIGDYDRAYRRLHPKLHRSLLKGNYKTQPVRRVHIPKAGTGGATRPLGIPTVIDRVVQQAVRAGLEPIFEAQFHDHSYGFRPQRSAKDALHHVSRCLRAEQCWIVDADLSSFFDTIDHTVLMQLIKVHVSDQRLLKLLRQFLNAGVMEDGVITYSNSGTPQGGVISPLLANIFLNALDHLVNDAGFEMIRYADDFVIACHSEADAQRALDLVRQWTDQRLLRLHPEKTHIVDMSVEGASFEFLGFTLKRHTLRRSGKSKMLRLPRAASIARLRDGIRQETRRCNGNSLEEIIRRINRRIVGWGNYFRSAVRNSLETLDRWIRMRLRSIKRKRSKRKGRGRGHDHNRWPNLYFAKHGLVALTSIHDAWLSP